MALPKDTSQSLADSVEASLEALDDELTGADMALVTSIRLAAELIDQLSAEGELAKALGYMYLVTGGMEKLGGSVEARKKLGTSAKKPKSRLAAVRGIHDGPDGGAATAKQGTRSSKTKGA